MNISTINNSFHLVELIRPRPEGTEIYFKIVTNHSYAYSWPAENRLIYIYETGAFSIDIIFDPNAPDNQKINIDMNKIF